MNCSLIQRHNLQSNALQSRLRISPIKKAVHERRSNSSTAPLFHYECIHRAAMCMPLVLPLCTAHPAKNPAVLLRHQEQPARLLCVPDDPMTLAMYKLFQRCRLTPSKRPIRIIGGLGGNATKLIGIFGPRRTNRYCALFPKYYRPRSFFDTSPPSYFPHRIECFSVSIFALRSPTFATSVIARAGNSQRPESPRRIEPRKSSSSLVRRNWISAILKSRERNRYEIVETTATGVISTPPGISTNRSTHNHIPDGIGTGVSPAWLAMLA